jgi:hypothetical protein
MSEILCDERFKTRQESNIIKWCLKQSELTRDKMAEAIGFNINVFNNKLSRSSFTFRELIIAAYMAGYDFALCSKNDMNAPPIRITLEEYFNGNCETLSKIKESVYREKYDALKKELISMKIKYGFKD